MADRHPEHPTAGIQAAEGKLYLCAVKDLHSNRIAGYSIDSRMTASLAVAALRNAIALRGWPHGVTVHSDRGSQGGFNRSSQHVDRLDPGRSARRAQRAALMKARWAKQCHLFVQQGSPDPSVTVGQNRRLLTVCQISLVRSFGCAAEYPWQQSLGGSTCQ